MEIYSYFVKTAFSLALFVNALLFIPQAVRILKQSSAESVSLQTFTGFLIIQIISIAYGFEVKDWILTFGFALSAVACSSVILLALFFRLKKPK